MYDPKSQNRVSLWDFCMKYIHSFGMIHCDLKLENIMMNDLFKSKIINFGLTGKLVETFSSL